MKKFDENYKLINDMYEDEYFPKMCVDKVRILIENVISFLETGQTDTLKIQKELDKMTISINDLQDEFDENDSEIETVARDSIAVTIEYILQWFEINIDIETALEEREW